METDGELHLAGVVQATNASAFTIATLAAELNLLVDQLESDWTTRMTVTDQTAARIHELRERVEQLFGNSE
jgi:outer membrane murein-binding lipoprotein Lpp